MSYTNLVSCHVSDAVRADFYALAKSRDMSVASLLRQMIVREIHAPPDAIAIILRHTLFLAVGMDGLLATHSDKSLRPKTIELWRERLVREGFSHEA
jgi:hypothetical protein